MADTALILPTIRNLVYEEIGSPARDLPNTENGTIEDKVTLAARKIALSIGAGRTGEDAKLDSFESVADQQKYLIPDNRQIVEVFWGAENLSSSVPQDIYADQFGGIPGSSLAGGPVSGYYWRSDQVIADLKRESLRDRYFWELLDGYIYLYPVPGSVLSVYYTYFEEQGTVADLDAKYEQAVVFLASAYCCRVLANRFRGRGNPVTDRGMADLSKTEEWLGMFAHYTEQFQVEMMELAG